MKKAFAIACLMMSGCSTTYYFYQAGLGQLSLSNRARPLAQIIADPRTPNQLKELLGEVPQIKSFGEEKGLKATSNYDSYVQLKSDAVVWVVAASEKLEFKPKVWSFPIVGSFNYLGWFSKTDAVEHAEKLRKDGWDTYVRGASAFSTLGWFRDPILSSMISKSELARADLVNVVLHESVHATVYIPDQSYFNESVASFIADELTRQYFEKYSNSGGEYQAFDQRRVRSVKSRERLRNIYFQLEKLYGENLPEEEKIKQKEKILSDLEKKLAYKSEVNQNRLSNAFLIQYRTYDTGKESFERLLNVCKGNIENFVKVVQGMSESSFKKKHQEDLHTSISPLVLSGCQT